MKRILAITAALAMLIPLAALAGGHCKECKCDKPVQDCLNSMVTKLKSTGFIGVELDKDKKTEALKVSKIIPGTPAEKAGIQVGDVLVGLNGIEFNKENDKAISKVKVPGAKVTVNIKRNGVPQGIKMTLAPMPADVMAKYIGEHMMMHAQADAGKS